MNVFVLQLLNDVATHDFTADAMLFSTNHEWLTTRDRLLSCRTTTLNLVKSSISLN